MADLPKWLCYAAYQSFAKQLFAPLAFHCANEQVCWAASFNNADWQPLW